MTLIGQKISRVTGRLVSFVTRSGRPAPSVKKKRSAHGLRRITDDLSEEQWQAILALPWWHPNAKRVIEEIHRRGNCGFSRRIGYALCGSTREPAHGSFLSINGYLKKWRVTFRLYVVRPYNFVTDDDPTKGKLGALDHEMRIFEVHQKRKSA